MLFVRKLSTIVFVFTMFLSKHAFADFEGCAMAMLTQLQKDEALLNQMDQRLADANLLVAGHGVCGPTCMFNLFQVIRLETGVQIGLSNGVEQIKKFYFDFKKIGKPDIRTGVESDNLAEYIRSEIANSDVKATVEVKKDRIKINDLVLPNQKIILTISELNQKGGHAVIFKGVDSIKKKIVIVDPNFPLTDTELSYTESDDLIHLSAPELFDRYEFRNAYISSSITVSNLKLRRPFTQAQSDIQNKVSEKVAGLGAIGFNLTHYRGGLLRVFYFNGNYIEGILEDYHYDGTEDGIVLDFRVDRRLNSVKMGNIRSIQFVPR